MKIFTFSQQGKRSNNEDYFGYNERLWIVCDGVGGHVSGERASRFVVEYLLNEFQQEVPGLNKKIIQERLDNVQVSLNRVLDSEPELEKMGTTFTGIFKTDTYWYAAHIGDSRIYLFRPAEKKLWHTWDHSLVGEMMRHHDITREEGRFHPMSNRISKAILANTDGKINTASISTIDELKPGDLFLLCSDGVVEAWGDHDLTRLFSDPNLTFEQKGEKLREQCAHLSKDNNTALLLQVEVSDAFSFGHNEELTWVAFQEIDDDYKVYQNKIKAKQEDQDDIVVDLSNLPTQKEDASDVTAVTKSASPAASEPNVVASDAAADKKAIKHLKTAVFLLIAAILMSGVFMAVRQFSGSKTVETAIGDTMQVADNPVVENVEPGDAQPASLPRNMDNNKKQYVNSIQNGKSFYNQGKYEDALRCFQNAKNIANSTADKKEIDVWIRNCEAKLKSDTSNANERTDSVDTDAVKRNSLDSVNKMNYSKVIIKDSTNTR